MLRLREKAPFFCLFRKMTVTGVEMSNAPPMTKASEGSHALDAMDKKPATLVALVMPETPNPIEKRAPAVNSTAWASQGRSWGERGGERGG